MESQPYVLDLNGPSGVACGVALWLAGPSGVEAEASLPL
jgi:hypothetical protein